MSGFGLAASGAGAAHAIAAHPDDAKGGIVLAGAAGTYNPGRLPVGAAIDAASVRLDGIGAGGAGPAELGFAESDVLDLGGGEGQLLSVAEASATTADAVARSRRFPDALAEEMEGFGVAVAASLFGVPLRIVRGISNVAGDRDHAGWRMADALAAVRVRIEALR